MIQIFSKVVFLAISVLLGIATLFAPMGAKGSASLTKPSNFHFSNPITEARMEGQAVCAQLPPHFNSLTATPLEIAYYGLPMRPTNSKDLPLWLNFVEHAKYRSCGSGGHLKYPVQHQLELRGKFKPGVKYQLPHQSGNQLPTNDDSRNWSGIVDYMTNTGGPRFRSIQGVLTTACDVNRG